MNKVISETDIIKEHIYFLLKSGFDMSDENLLFLCLVLTELLGITLEDEEITEYSVTTMFATKMMKSIKKEDYDTFLSIIKNELLEQENYELLKELSL